MRIFNTQHYVALGKLMVILLDCCVGGKVHISFIFKHIVDMLQKDYPEFDAKKFEWYVDNNVHMDKILNHVHGR